MYYTINMKERLFIGIPIPERIKDSIYRDMAVPKNFKTVKKDNLHVTLLFLGAVEEDRIREICDTLDSIVKSVKPFYLSLDRYGQFPENGIARVIYLTGEEGKDNLYDLSRSVRYGMSELGFEDDKEFKYHVTVARLIEKTAIRNGYEPMILKDKLKYLAETVILYKSQLSIKGSLYTELWKGNFDG